MLTQTLKTALFVSALALPIFSAQAQSADQWFERADGSLIHEQAGLHCPTSVNGYDRIEEDAEANNGFCAYADDAHEEEFVVQFYERANQDIETELQRTLAHFEDEGAIVSLTTSVGCEASLASVADGGAPPEELDASFNDYAVNDELRCLVMEDANQDIWVISLQSAGDYYFTTINSSHELAELNDMVETSSEFHAMQFSSPAV
ncbi:hypothetical protein [Ponticaulis sp.]|uniref:hypothetical protein n=1 Tax=Ponticaulis sp. TaxID=2020902 RepID=UPI000B6BDCC0|nr:hypothetical protein [Ponticaulis sp.]MAI90936.1 hypothetical protein [Ponticaulis sp.]OUX98279.1 MAG: hypothetical protein CBB65_10865 [Hyphomonadaceae bacterium TMED5]|tara:strand:- start:26431 stop:27045 length:615 start_codon:yes stop_codon:yes gene_type:complete